MNKNSNVLRLENIDFFCVKAYNKRIPPSHRGESEGEGGKEMKILLTEVAKEEILKQNTRNKAIRIYAGGFG